MHEVKIDSEIYSQLERIPDKYRNGALCMTELMMKHPAYGNEE